MSHLYFVVIIFLCSFSFHQTSSASKAYLTHEFAKLIEANPKFIKFHVFNFYKKDRTNHALNMTFTLLTEYKTAEDGKVAAFQLRNNVYKKTVIDFSINICDLLTTTTFNVGTLLTNSNVTACPVKKGTYYANEISPNVETLPPHMPEGKWMLDLTFRRLNETIGRVQWMITIAKVIGKKK